MKNICSQQYSKKVQKKKKEKEIKPKIKYIIQDFTKTIFKNTVP